jgi:putative transposase
MTFNLIDQAKEAFPVHRLCSVLGISQSGYFARKKHITKSSQRFK